MKYNAEETTLSYSLVLDKPWFLVPRVTHNVIT